MTAVRYVYRIFDRRTSEPVGSYSRSYHDEYDFASAEQARSANCHDMFQNRDKYRIAKIEVIEKVVEEDVP
jgi:hypothetical protein